MIAALLGRSAGGRAQVKRTFEVVAFDPASGTQIGAVEPATERSSSGLVMLPRSALATSPTPEAAD